MMMEKKMTALALPLIFRRRPGLFARLWRMAALRRQRLDLARLDDRLLRDIGLTRTAAETEAARPAWDAPRHWRQ